MKSLLIKLILTFIIAVSPHSYAAKPLKDAKDSKDHPLVSRYPGSVIHRYTVTDFDEYQFPIGPIKNKTLPLETVEGEYTTIVYTLPKKLSTLQVMRNYEKAFKKAGLKTKFSCNQSNCGYYMPREFVKAQGDNNAKRIRYHGVDIYNANKRSDFRFWAGTLDKKGKKTYITFMVFKKNTSVRAFLDVLEIKQMDTDLVTLNVDAISDSLKSEGKVVLSGIFFDYDKDTLKPSSNESIEVIAKYLKANPNIKTYVVGHTDNNGNFKHNMELSTRRAKRVAEKLITTYKIPKTQLTPIGIGPVSPAGSNADEEGRKQNRRVELVLQ